MSGAGTATRVRSKASAEANHLRPSYLRQLLTTPPNSLEPIQLDKLAALAGRDPAVLVRAPPELAPRTRTPGKARENEARKALNEQRKRERFAAIRYAHLMIWDMTDLDVEECIARDVQRGRAGGRWIGADEIRRQHQLLRQ